MQLSELSYASNSMPSGSYTTASAFKSTTNQINNYDINVCSSPELDVVSCTPGPQSSSSSADDVNNQKRYFCQRCLNHKLEYPRKGHKPFCRYALCNCEDCMMVEYRRRLNNQLSQRKLDPDLTVINKRTNAGKKVRDPKCARCSAHGEKQALRGHKKATCPYLKCGCHLCNLVENRRTLMAKQIKLRRDQQKARRAQLQDSNLDHQKKSFDVKFKENNKKNITKIDKNSTFIAPSVNYERPKHNIKYFVDSSAISNDSNNNQSKNNKTVNFGEKTFGVYSNENLNLNLISSVSSLDKINNSMSIMPPPSLLYQQLCLQNQQQKTKVSSFSNEFNEMNFSPKLSTPLTSVSNYNLLSQLTSTSFPSINTVINTNNTNKELNSISNQSFLFPFPLKTTINTLKYGEINLQNSLLSNTQLNHHSTIQTLSPSFNSSQSNFNKTIATSHVSPSLFLLNSAITATACNEINSNGNSIVQTPNSNSSQSASPTSSFSLAFPSLLSATVADNITPPTFYNNNDKINLKNQITPQSFEITSALKAFDLMYPQQSKTNFLNTQNLSKTIIDFQQKPLLEMPQFNNNVANFDSKLNSVTDVIKKLFSIAGLSNFVAPKIQNDELKTLAPNLSMLTQNLSTTAVTERDITKQSLLFPFNDFLFNNSAPANNNTGV